MKTLELDLETFSDVDLLSAGVYPYAESSQFDLLLFGYSVDGGEVQVVDVVNGECIPDHILKALTDDSVLKYAHNASFERICLSVYLRRHYPEYFRSYSIPEDSVGGYLDPAAWRCTMVWAAYDCLPLSLRNVGAALHLDSQKMDEGKALIRFFCVPDKNGVRHYPAEASDKWEVFKQYKKRDVEVEMAMQTVACHDHRARGTFQFYGASRSGRFAGRYIQLQNLPQNHIEDLAETRELLKSGDYDAMQLLYDNIPDTLSQLIRTAFMHQELRSEVRREYRAGHCPRSSLLQYEYAVALFYRSNGA